MLSEPLDADRSSKAAIVDRGGAGVSVADINNLIDQVQQQVTEQKMLDLAGSKKSSGGKHDEEEDYLRSTFLQLFTKISA